MGIGFLIFTRVAHTQEAKYSDAETYRVYDSFKQDKIEDFPLVGIHGSRKYISRLLKSSVPTGGTGRVSAPVSTSFLPEGYTVITDKTADEQLAEFLLESFVYIGSVQAKINIALKKYNSDIQKSMIKELKKVAADVYQELERDEDMVVHASKLRKETLYSYEDNNEIERGAEGRGTFQFF